MEAIELLKRDALLRRNAAILKAKRDYYNELKAIKAFERKLGGLYQQRAVCFRDAS